MRKKMRHITHFLIFNKRCLVLLNSWQSLHKGNIIDKSMVYIDLQCIMKIIDANVSLQFTKMNTIQLVVIKCFYHN